MAFTRPPVTAADATFSAAGAAAWAAGFGVAGATVGGIPYCPTATSEETSANLLYTETSGPRLQVGSGSGANSGFIIGARGTNNDGVIFATNSPTEVVFRSNGGDTVVAAATNVYINHGGGTKAQFNATAGRGPDIYAGTAASAVSALTLTQTWNYNTAAIQGVDWTFTDTSSHANTNAFRIRGGAAGTTSLLEVSKAGITLSPNFRTSAGSVSVSSIGPSAETNSGFWFEAGSTIGSIAGNNIHFTSASLFRLKSSLILGWASGDPYTTNADTGFSRISAGVIGVGTGAAGSVAGQLNLTTLSVAGVTYANRPGTPVAGMVVYITDSSTATWGATIAGSGANKVLAFYNGTNWTVAGA